jgi:hypothetical protein
MPPQIVSDQLDPQDRLQELLGTRQGTQLATGAAFRQLFDPSLSGQQQDTLQALIKNRKARGLRGAAAEVASTQLGEQFAASNRLQALGFLGQQFQKQGDVPLGIAPGGQVGVTPREGAFFGATTQGSSTSGFQALLGEITGLQTLAAKEGAAGLNRFIEAAQQPGGSRLDAFERLFPGASSDPNLRTILSPQESIKEQIGGLRGLLGNFLGSREFQAIQLTPEIMQKLGVEDPRATGQGLAGLNNPSINLQGRFTETFGDVLPKGISLQAEALLDPSRARPELGAFLTFRGDVEDLAQFNLTLQDPEFSRQFGEAVPLIRDPFSGAESKDVKNVLSQLGQLRDLQKELADPLGQTDLFEGLQSQLTSAQRDDPFTQLIGSVNPITGNPRITEEQRRLSAEQRTARISSLEGQLDQFSEFTTKLFSPEQPFDFFA